MASQTYVDGVTLTAAAEFNRFDTVSYAVLSAVSGTNTIAATGAANYTYAATTPPVWFIPAATNTGATTINITPSGGAALGAKNVFFAGAACVGGEITSGVPISVIYDGTQFNIVANGKTPRQATLGTEQASTSGTSIDFTSIPSWAKEIKIHFCGVSTSGTSRPRIQLGISSGVETSGYTGASIVTTNGGTVTGLNFGSGFDLETALAANVIDGTVTLSLEDSTDNTWTISGVLALTAVVSTIQVAGRKALAGTLDRVRITTIGGADTFDLGAINITYR